MMYVVILAPFPILSCLTAFFFLFRFMATNPDDKDVPTIKKWLLIFFLYLIIGSLLITGCSCMMPD